MRSFLKMADARGRLSITAKICAVPPHFCYETFGTAGGFEIAQFQKDPKLMPIPTPAQSPDGPPIGDDDYAWLP